jgi:hypothetical protein
MTFSLGIPLFREDYAFCRFSSRSMVDSGSFAIFGPGSGKQGAIQDADTIRTVNDGDIWLTVPAALVQRLQELVNSVMAH